MVLNIIYFKYNNKDLWSNEWKTIKQHSEIGHRITIATPQLEHIAEYILSHHERWDGAGYPKASFFGRALRYILSSVIASKASAMERNP